MTDFTAGVGRTKPMCSLPSVLDPVLSRAVDSLPLDPIRTMFEHLMASMARMEARMDDFDRLSSWSRHPILPEPEQLHSRPVQPPFYQPERYPPPPDPDPPYALPASVDHGATPPPNQPPDPWGNRFPDLPEPPPSRAQSRPLEVPLPFTQPFAAVSVMTPPSPASSAFLGWPEGCRPNPSCASSPFRAGFTPQQSSWELPPTSSERNSHWESPPSTRSQQIQPWGLPPSSTNSTAWDPWGNRSPDYQFHSGQASWDQLGRQPAPPQPPTYDHPLPPGWPPHIHFPKLEYNLNSHVCGNERHESKQQKREDSYSTSWVTQMEYSCDNARDFGFSECRVAEEDRCDEWERVHPTDSIFETKAKEALVHVVATSDTEVVTIPTSDLPAIQEEDVHVSKNVVESRDEQSS